MSRLLLLACTFVLLAAVEGRSLHEAERDGRSLNIIEGDILIETEDTHNIKRRSMARNRLALWQDRIVPYEIDPNLSSEAQSGVREAIHLYNHDPTICIKFVKRENHHSAYLHFRKDKGCYSYVGRRGGAQTVSVDDECTKMGTVAHEIMHALGFWHEHTRADRENHVRILYENVQKGKSANFDVRNLTQSEVFSKYDYDSVMHYAADAFSKNGQPTIMTIPKTVAIGQRDAPSKADLRAIAYLYSCTTPDGVWSAWSSCQQCNQQRSRICFGPSATACGGSSAIEYHTEKCPCNEPVAWGSWSAWSVCSQTCGGGERYQYRPCKNGIAGAVGCLEDDINIEACNTNTCNLWSSWSDWTKCSATCGEGKRIKTRQCLAKERGAGKCNGRSEMTSVCKADEPCEYWGQWSDWSKCSAHCGEGEQKRTRNCENGSPGEGGCQGENAETNVCVSSNPCEKWSKWSEWSHCSVTCGIGMKTKSRTCDGGTPGEGRCRGDAEETENCVAENPCEYWGDWTDWTECSVSCGEGIRTKGRECVYGSPGKGDCQGKAELTAICKAAELCEYWSHWSEWGTCSATCGNGEKMRTRRCEYGEAGEGGCTGEEEDRTSCSADELCHYWGVWSTWSSCSASCGYGEMTKTRACTKGEIGEDECPGEPTMVTECSIPACDDVLFGCGFDRDTCQWTNTLSSTWIREMHSEPGDDENTIGRMYLAAILPSNEGKKNIKKFALVSPLFAGKGSGTYCLSLMHRMVGFADAHLTVSWISNESGQWSQNPIGQMKEKNAYNWRTFAGTFKTATNFKIMIQAAINGNGAEIGIDDVIITEGECQAS